MKYIFFISAIRTGRMFSIQFTAGALHDSPHARVFREIMFHDFIIEVTVTASDSMSAITNNIA